MAYNGKAKKSEFFLQIGLNYVRFWEEAIYKEEHHEKS